MTISTKLQTLTRPSSTLNLANSQLQTLSTQLYHTFHH
jgi:hypothetical protein